MTPRGIPRLHIVIALEEPLAIYYEADTDELAARLDAWIARRRDLDELVSRAARDRRPRAHEARGMNGLILKTIEEFAAEHEETADPLLGSRK